MCSAADAILNLPREFERNSYGFIYFELFMKGKICTGNINITRSV